MPVHRDPARQITSAQPQPVRLGAVHRRPLQHLLQLGGRGELPPHQRGHELVQVLGTGHQGTRALRPRRRLLRRVDLPSGGVGGHVAAGVLAGDRVLRVDVERVVELQRLDDAVLVRGGHRLLGDLLDEHARDHEVGVRVRVDRARLVGERLGQRQVHQLTVGVDLVPYLLEARHAGGEEGVGVVVQPAAVAEHMTHGDPLVGQQPRQICVDRGVELDLSLVDQLQQDHRRERLGDAADADTVPGAEGPLGGPVRDTFRQMMHRAAVVDPRERARRSLRQRRAQQFSQPGRVGPRLRGRVGGHRQEGQHDRAQRGHARAHRSRNHLIRLPSLVRHRQVHWSRVITENQVARCGGELSDSKEGQSRRIGFSRRRAGSSTCRPRRRRRSRHLYG